MDASKARIFDQSEFQGKNSIFSIDPKVIELFHYFVSPLWKELFLGSDEPFKDGPRKYCLIYNRKARNKKERTDKNRVAPKTTKAAVGRPQYFLNGRSTLLVRAF